MKQKEDIALLKFSALGDIASIEPYVKILQKKYDLTLVTSNIGYQYFKDYKNIKFIVIRNKNNIWENIKVFSKLFSFSRVIDLQANDRSKLLTFGKSKKVISNYVSDYKVEESDHKYIKNNSVFHIYIYSILKRLVSSDELTSQTTYIEDHEKYIVLNCGSSEKWTSKRLPTEIWKQISKELYEKYKLPFYLTGDTSEIVYLNNLSKELCGEKHIIAGETSLQELKVVLKDAFLTISTDSAAMHISAVQGTPTIGIFGATNWIKSAPFGDWSTVVYDKTFFKNGLPLEKNTTEVNPQMYKNIDIKNALQEIDNYLKIKGIK